tara:strand:+ start:9395 stop:9610 length:216 start_codon:yes stop_codon:yes gene_type:complete
MFIKTIINQNRRDFKGIYECEHCSKQETAGGYDDENFHKNVVPKMACKACGETAPSTFRPLAPLHAAHEVV